MFCCQNLRGLLCPIRQLVGVAVVAWFPILVSLFPFITQFQLPFICPPCSLNSKAVKNKWMSVMQQHRKCVFSLWRCALVYKLFHFKYRNAAQPYRTDCLGGKKTKFHSFFHFFWHLNDRRKIKVRDERRDGNENRCLIFCLACEAVRWSERPILIAGWVSASWWGCTDTQDSYFISQGGL